MVNLVRVFWSPDDQKCPQRVLLGFVVWGSKKLFMEVLTKIKIIFILKKDSNYFNKIHRKKKFFEHDEQKFFFANYPQWRTY